jgi:hypothetical protein
VAGKLSARFVATAEPGEYLDGHGLYLCVSPSRSRSWVFRFSFQGRRPKMGLGHFPFISLAEATDLRDEARRILRTGRNPIEERRCAKATSARPTFGKVAEDLLERKAGEIRNGRNLDQWRASLRIGAAALRDRRVDEIDTEACPGSAPLRQIWD